MKDNFIYNSFNKIEKFLVQRLKASEHIKDVKYKNILLHRSKFLLQELERLRRKHGEGLLELVCSYRAIFDSILPNTENAHVMESIRMSELFDNIQQKTDRAIRAKVPSMYWEEFKTQLAKEGISHRWLNGGIKAKDTYYLIEIRYTKTYDNIISN